MTAATKIQDAHDAIEALLDSEDIAVSSDAGDYLVGVQETLFEAKTLAAHATLQITTKTTEHPEFFAAWNEFGEVNVNGDDETEAPFRHFPIGTDRDTIWAWFEAEFNVTLGNLYSTTTVTIDTRQLAAILAGLRLVQAEIPRGEFLPQGVHMIFDAEGTIEPLSEDEIDHLCEKINCA